jgi:hypothetical protein
MHRLAKSAQRRTDMPPPAKRVIYKKSASQKLQANLYAKRKQESRSELIAKLREIMGSPSVSMTDLLKRALTLVEKHTKYEPETDTNDDALFGRRFDDVNPSTRMQRKHSYLRELLADRLNLKAPINENALYAELLKFLEDRA